jgi:hypothetical protein
MLERLPPRPGRSLEFVATFAAVANQHVGFGTDLNSAPWALFSTKDGSGLFARSNTGSDTFTLIPGSWLGAPHRYRIDWNASSVDYTIDGTLVASHPVTLSQSMRPLASDLTLGGPALVVDWMHMTPFAASGNFTSRVFDSQGIGQWGGASWSADTPAGTTVSLNVRRGNSPAPDGTWDCVRRDRDEWRYGGRKSRYIQYRADLTSSSSGITPVLQDVHIACVSGPDTDPPIISSVVGSPNPGGASAVVTWSTDEMSDSYIEYGTSPSLLTSSASDTAFVSTHSVPLLV